MSLVFVVSITLTKLLPQAPLNKNFQQPIIPENIERDWVWYKQRVKNTSCRPMVMMMIMMKHFSQMASSVVLRLMDVEGVYL